MQSSSARHWHIYMANGIPKLNTKTSKNTYIAKLCDLGISRFKVMGFAKRTSVTGIPGTPMFMAPETLIERKTCAESDIWSLACTLLEMYSKKDDWDVPESADCQDTRMLTV